MKHENILRFLDLLLLTSSIILAGVVVIFGFTIWTTQAHYSVLFLMLSLVIISLRHLKIAITSERWINGIWLILTIVLIVVPSLYFYLNYVALLYREGGNISIDYVFALLILIPLLFLIWKEGGKALTIMIFLFVFYAFFGNIFPRLLFHEGLSPVRFVEVQILSFEGIYGFITHVVATWVAIFIIYAGLLQAFGALETIMKILLSIGRHYQKIMPQIPIVVSMIFGSFSGSAAANVAGTGSFTIPVLKRLGFKPQFAGAIESVASSGGQIMPPIMGATAFLMSSILGEPYVKIMLIGFIPAVLFYSSVGFSVYLLSHESVIKSTIAEETSGEKILKSDIFKLLPMALSLAVLLTSLAYFRRPLMESALYGICSFLIAQLAYELLHSRKKLLLHFCRCVLEGARKGAFVAATIGLVGAAMGFIIKILTVTALAPKLSFLMVDLSGGSLAILLLLVLIVSLLFGAALATLAVYILVVFLAAPALLEFWIEPLVSHFIIYYFGSLAMITPPVAPAALVASGIAGTGFMTTAWESVKLGLPLLLLPLSFVIYPELISVSLATPKAILFVGVALWFVSYSIFSPGKGTLGIIKRVVCGIGGVFILLYPAKNLHFFVGLVVILMFSVDILIRKLYTR
jgi:TRAP transporter 4TM/12TM fusion protein